MTCDLDVSSPPERILRIGRAPNPWSWTDWSYAHNDGTFGNRWDDPESEYRVLYASTQRLSCFMETIGRFTGDPQVTTSLEEIELEPGEIDHAVAPGTLVVADWVARRRIGGGGVQGGFAAVGTSPSLSYLHGRLADVLDDFGLEELDGAALRSGRRQLTQLISRMVFECSTPEGQREFAGIRYLSRYGDEFENWAIFEPATIDTEQPGQIAPDDLDLIEAARRLGVTLV